MASKIFNIIALVAVVVMVFVCCSQANPVPENEVETVEAGAREGRYFGVGTAQASATATAGAVGTGGLGYGGYPYGGWGGIGYPYGK